MIHAAQNRIPETAGTRGNKNSNQKQQEGRRCYRATLLFLSLLNKSRCPESAFFLPRIAESHNINIRIEGAASVEPLSQTRGFQARLRFKTSSQCLVAAATARTATAATAAAFARLVAITAENRTIAAWLKWHCRWLATSRADHRRSLCWSRTVAGTSPPLVVLLCHAARLATFWGRITAFLKERLIRSGEGKVLPAVAARKLNISGHGSPRGVCEAQHNFSL